MTSADRVRPDWQRIPDTGPIAQVLGRRLRWLKTQAAGDPDSREVTLHDLADDGRTEDRIRQGYTGRAPMELLQNAHDALADVGERGRVHLRVTGTALLVANHGQPFDVARIRSLTRLGSSEKASRRKRHHQIGYKGIGFTSVFEVSDRPQILSRDVGFAFDRTASAALVVEHLGQGLDGPVPARYFPLPLEDGELGDDEPSVAQLFGTGVATVIRLPFRTDRAREDVVAAVRETLVPEILLFLPAVDSFSLDDGAGITVWQRRDGSRTGAGRIVHLESDGGTRLSWLLATRFVAIDPDVVDALDDELWAGVRRLSVSVAVPWSERGPGAALADSRIHSYFPTDDRLGRGVVIHGDFYLDGSRRRLELAGHGGAVTRVAMAGAAALTADLVASVARWGRAVLQSCTPSGGADASGELFGEQLEAVLADRLIARPATGGIPRRPRDLVRLGLDLEVRDTKRLAAALDPVDDLLDPFDDTGVTRRLLDRLGCTRLGPAEVAERIDLTNVDLPYAAGLALLGRWLNTTDWERHQALDVLGGRPVVQEADGAWVAPNDVERRVEGAPVLPEALRRATLLEPRGITARAVVDSLNIALLSADTALSRLLDAIETGEFSTTNAERTQAIELAWAIWRSSPAALSDERDRIGMLEVATRTARAKVERQWRRADETYFGADALGDRTLEQLYAPLGEPEFLAESLGPTASERRQRLAFYTALGVASRPREVPIQRPHAKHEAEWRTGGGRDEAWLCPNGHDYSGRLVTGWMIDRLDDILEAVDDPDTAGALARGLAMLVEPYGPPSAVQCTNSSHGGHAPARPVLGYQRWRLEQVPWIPVTNDPNGATLQVPAHAWRGIRRTTTWLLVPRARLRPQDAEALRLVFAERPAPEEVEIALAALEEQHPDLDTAPIEVRDSADWLLRRLERVLVRGERRHAASPPLPAHGPDGWCWSREAVVANVPGLPRVPGIDLLPAGRWTGLQRSYGLKVARDRVIAVIRAGARRQVPLLLTTPRRVHLLALLLRRGGDAERMAARLAALRERPVASLELAWRVGEIVTPVPEARFVLEPTRDKRGYVIRGELTWVAGSEPDAMELGRALAEYLELPEDDSEIAQFLTNPGRLVEQRGLGPGELDDAEYLLRSRRYFAETPEVSGGHGRETRASLDPASWAVPTGSDARVERSADSPTKDYVDPTVVQFGMPERIELRPPRKEQPESTMRAKEGRSGPRRAVSLTRPMAPAAPDAVRATASGKRSEEAAVAIVTRFGAGLPEVVGVDDVQDENRGWDLEFRLRDGGMIPVEVKGSSGSGTFVLTANEWEAARAHPEFVLYHVVDLTAPGRTRMRVYEGLGAKLTNELVSAAGWAVTGWRELGPVEIPVLLPDLLERHNGAAKAQREGP